MENLDLISYGVFLQLTFAVTEIQILTNIVNI